ncbi:MAG: asparagine synthase (glutamine-hydrolyzing) [Candidatus Omnitrophota bacterium]|nr:asparagine synthase (glutamine-hydrolyzing) [Candidatus Omnitrophota bacterium]
MCGICGFIGFKDEKLLKEMTDTISHRGLDDEGYYSTDEINLGFRRLSIIDLKGGNQPLCNEEKSIWSVCNGEIYNFKEIKEELIKYGHIFNTDTDTEILPHCYEQWGIDFVTRINGMFAFALWDGNIKKLFLVRDRLGIRPLHYTFDDRKLVFASEVKAILKYDNFRKELDYNAIDDFLTFRYIPGDVTFFKNIKILEPAHILIYHNGAIDIKKYWDITMEEDFSIQRQEYIQRFSSLLDSSVKRCLLSDVPLGVYLSGGLDSSVIAGLVKKNYGEDLVVFSHGFDGEEDELRFARKVAKFLNAKNYEIFIEEKHLELLPDIIYHLDMPIANSDIIGFFLLAGLAQKHVKVILTGEGSDELFGSYVHQEMLYYGYKLKRLLPKNVIKNVLPWFIKQSPLWLINKFFRYPGYSLDNESRLKLLDYFESSNLASDYFCINSLFNQRQKESLYSDDFKNKVKYSNSPAKKVLQDILYDENIKHIFNRLIYLEFKYWLPTYHLMKEDKIAMSFCLESRYPYLDHEIVEFMGSLPVSLKKKGLKRKYLLRKISKNLVPEEIRNRPKGPILVPINKCFDKSFEQKLRELFTPEKVKKRGIFHYEYLKNLINNRKQNPFLYDRQLFALLTLEIWFNLFVDKNGR